VELNHAIMKDSNESVFYYNRGNVFFKLASFDKAHLDFDKAIQMDNSNPKFYHSKGLAYEEEGKKTKDQEMQKNAIKYFKLALM